MIVRVGDAYKGIEVGIRYLGLVDEFSDYLRKVEYHYTLLGVQNTDEDSFSNTNNSHLEGLYSQLVRHNRTKPTYDYVSPTRETNNHVSSLFNSSIVQQPAELIPEANPFTFYFSPHFEEHFEEVLSIQERIVNLWNKYKVSQDNEILLEIKKLIEYRREEVQEFRLMINRGIGNFKIIIAIILKSILSISSRRKFLRFQMKLISKGSIDEDFALIALRLKASNAISCKNLIYLSNEKRRFTR